MKKRNKKEEYEQMWEVFREIWKESKHSKRICFETGTPLREPILSTYFHHVLPKSKFPEYKFSKWNIVLLSPEVHAALELNEDKAPKVKQLKEELLNKHYNKELKP